MQAFPGVDIIDIYDSITGNASPASLDPNELIDLYSLVDVFAIQNLVTELYIPAWNSTESMIVAFNSFYDIRYMASWYKNYDFNQELTDDTCISAKEMWEVLPRWSKWLGPDFQEAYFAVKKQGLILARANFQYENRNEWVFNDIEMAGIKPSTCLEVHELQYSMN